MARPTKGGRPFSITMAMVTGMGTPPTQPKRAVLRINTKPLTVGHTYVYRISLDDGSFSNFQFGLK